MEIRKMEYEATDFDGNSWTQQTKLPHDMAMNEAIDYIMELPENTDIRYYQSFRERIGK